MKTLLAYRKYQNSSVKTIATLLFFANVTIIPTCLSRTFYGDAEVENIVSVYDGDTFKADIKNFTIKVGGEKKIFEDQHPIISKNMSIRVYGIDTPEIKSKSARVKELAIKARDRARALLAAAKKIELKQIEKDKYFRFDAIVLIDGIDLGEILIEEKLALKYDGGKKADWQAIVEKQDD